MQGARRGWLVLDGPVDPLWVEMLNPVLDDNKTLCLTSGETLPLRDGVNIIMEVDSISRASPATISRCGIIFMDKSSGECIRTGGGASMGFRFRSGASFGIC